MANITRIGILTGGGDAPGLNAVIRAVVKAAFNAGIECIGLEDSFDGLLEPGRSRLLTPRDVRGIMRLGGTILGTVNTGNPFSRQIETSGGTREYSDRVVEMFHEMGLGALVAIGGDGTLAIAHQFGARGIPIVGVPKTIDNDIVGTTNCFGFDTAVAFATDAIDRLHTTAEAHRRIMVVEVMGRYAGWIALYAGVAGGADAILIPEIPFDLQKVATKLIERDKWGAHFSIVVVAEGATPTGGHVALVERAHDGHVERLGGIGAQVCEGLSQLAGKETRSVVLGHLQRGGAPTSFDRVLATRFGAKAVQLVIAGEFGRMVAFDPPDIIARPFEEIVGRTKTVPLDHDLLLTAKALGITFGDRMINPIAQKPAVLTLPGMDAVAVQADIPYQLSDVQRTFDLYHPPGSTPATKLPAIIFVSGASDAGMERAMGCRFKDMGSTTSWARLVAASGMIGVVYANGDPDDVHAVLAHIRHYADRLGIDRTRIGLWASSGHVPMALAVLNKDRVIRCAALLYGYTLDWPGSTLVADTLKTWGFANPASGKAAKDLRADVPIFIARAGLDHFPHLNAALDRFVGDALTRNMPLEVVNHATGHHAFDILDDTEETRAVIARTLGFLMKRLDQAPGL